MAATIPAVEGADDADPLRMGCPNSEANAFCVAVANRARTELLKEPHVLSADEQILILVGKPRLGKGIRVAQAKQPALAVDHHESVVDIAAACGDGGFEQSVVVDSAHVICPDRWLTDLDGDAMRVRQQSSNNDR